MSTKWQQSINKALALADHRARRPPSFMALALGSPWLVRDIARSNLYRMRAERIRIRYLGISVKEHHVYSDYELKTLGQRITIELAESRIAHPMVKYSILGGVVGILVMYITNLLIPSADVSHLWFITAVFGLLLGWVSRKSILQPLSDLEVTQILGHAQRHPSVLRWAVDAIASRKTLRIRDKDAALVAVAAAERWNSVQHVTDINRTLTPNEQDELVSSVDADAEEFARKHSQVSIQKFENGVVRITSRFNAHQMHMDRLLCFHKEDVRCIVASQETNVTLPGIVTVHLITAPPLELVCPTVDDAVLVADRLMQVIFDDPVLVGADATVSMY